MGGSCTFFPPFPTFTFLHSTHFENGLDTSQILDGNNVIRSTAPMRVLFRIDCVQEEG